MEVGLFVATTITSRTMSRDLFGKRYQLKQQEITARSEGRKRARKTLMCEARRSYFSQIDESSRAAGAQLESESFLQELAALAGSHPPQGD